MTLGELLTDEGFVFGSWEGLPKPFVIYFNKRFGKEAGSFVIYDPNCLDRYAAVGDDLDELLQRAYDDLGLAVYQHVKIPKNLKPGNPAHFAAVVKGMRGY